MRERFDDLPDGERLLIAERQVQHIVPGAVLVGGTDRALQLTPEQTQQLQKSVRDLVAHGSVEFEGISVHAHDTMRSRGQDPASLP